MHLIERKRISPSAVGNSNFSSVLAIFRESGEKDSSWLFKSTATFGKSFSDGDAAIVSKNLRVSTQEQENTETEKKKGLMKISNTSRMPSNLNRFLEVARSMPSSIPPQIFHRKRNRNSTLFKPRCFTLYSIIFSWSQINSRRSHL